MKKWYVLIVMMLIMQLYAYDQSWMYMSFDDGMHPELYPDSIERVNNIWGAPGKLV